MAAVYKSSNPQAGKIFKTFNIKIFRILESFWSSRKERMLHKCCALIFLYYRSPFKSLSYISGQSFRDLKEKLFLPFFFWETFSSTHFFPQRSSCVFSSGRPSSESSLGESCELDRHWAKTGLDVGFDINIYIYILMILKFCDVRFFCQRIGWSIVFSIQKHISGCFFRWESLSQLMW